MPDLTKTLDERVTDLETIYTDLPEILNLRLDGFERGTSETNARLGLMDRQFANLTRDVRDLRSGMTAQLRLLIEAQREQGATLLKYGETGLKQGEILLQQGQRLDRLEADVSTLKADVSTLKADVATLKTDVATLKEDVATIKEDVATIKSTLVEILDRIKK